MSSMIGNKIKVQIFGQSHSKSIGVVIDGLPAGESISLDAISAFLERRRGGKNAYSTKRAEEDIPNIVSGLVNGVTCGAPLCAIFENNDVKSEDYKDTEYLPRPSHADFTAFVKHHGFNDKTGGGHFSGRLTLPLCFAGAVCNQILNRRGVTIGAHISSIGDIEDTPYNPVTLRSDQLNLQGFPVLNTAMGEKMIALMEKTAKEGDSIGGTVECGIIGLPVGLGEPIFDNIESRLAFGVFAIPAVKGIEFGIGFESAKMRGSDYNDSFCVVDDMIKTKTNNCGGILGGISNGMPILFRAAFKPTPSIYKEQSSVDLETLTEATLKIKGRHDPCIVTRAVPCVEAITAIVICDIILGG